MSLPVKNPYSHLLNIMRKAGSMDNPDGMFAMTVVSMSPITLSDGELQINAQNILIADWLLPDHQVECEINGESTTITLKNVLKVGDLVAVMPSLDKQTYFVLWKMVKPNG